MSTDVTTEVLECFLNGRHIGRFERRYLATVEFAYADSPQSGGDAQVVSLSLPRDRPHEKSAARNFLSNLLPETEAAKELLRTQTGARSTDDFDLLRYVGGDVAGAIQLMPEGESPSEWIDPPLIARTNAISGRIQTIKATGIPTGGLIAGDWPIRFSLAGVQAKFALANVDGEWFWPDAGTPSTHILKPESPAHPGLEQLETAALRLAELAGVTAAVAEVAEFNGHTSFMTQRFDRVVDESGLPVRLHAEDAVQAHGKEVGFKYHLGADEIVELLRSRGTDEVAYDFVQQLAFNTGVKNADAHGKNYSFLHAPEGSVGLSPLYDVVPMGFYPQYAQALSMSIGDEEQLVRLDTSRWKQFADDTGLDTDRVLAIVTETSRGILEHVDEAFGHTGLSTREAAIAEIKRYNERIVARR